MDLTVKWRSGVATDQGNLRETNEDRWYVDDENGIFLVVDGVGGRPGGAAAADAALEAIRGEFQGHEELDVAVQVRRAIAEANNRIVRLSTSDDALQGMGCVLTLAVVRNGRMTVGHVGDSRLYLVTNGALQKMTSDHSPVGEREDGGELSELEAMLHPRRHEVFRNLGSRLREPDAPEFIELKEFPFEPDAAVLLCSDGLSDMLTSTEMLGIIEHYDGDANQTASALVSAANRAGGHDNVTAVFVAGSDFLGASSPKAVQARFRHEVTRERAQPKREKFKHLLESRTAFLLYGFMLGIFLAFTVLKFR